MSAHELAMQSAKTADRADNAQRIADYDSWYDDQVRLGLDDIDTGRIMTNDEANTHLAAHIAKQTKKRGREIG